jgi:hypothetical protein
MVRLTGCSLEAIHHEQVLHVPGLTEAAQDAVAGSVPIRIVPASWFAIPGGESSVANRHGVNRAALWWTKSTWRVRDLTVDTTPSDHNALVTDFKVQ